MFCPLVNLSQLKNAHHLADEAARVRREGTKRVSLETGTLECRHPERGFLFITQVYPCCHERDSEIYWNGPRTDSGYFKFQPIVRIVFNNESKELVSVQVDSHLYEKSQVTVMMKGT